jgi:hypothetical protein
VAPSRRGERLGLTMTGEEEQHPVVWAGLARQFIGDDPQDIFLRRIAIVEFEDLPHLKAIVAKIAKLRDSLLSPLISL